MRGRSWLKALRGTLNALRLLAFPAAEVAFMALALINWPSRPLLSVVCVLLAAASLSYSLHIVFHEVVHRRYFRHPLSSLVAESVISTLLGSPFNEYRQSHWRHHRYTNLLEDATSTWAATPQGPRPRHFLTYSLLWPAIGYRSISMLVNERRAGQVSDKVIRRILFETAVVLTLQAALALFVPVLWVIYGATVYLGYAGIAAINYIQHPPIEYGTGYTTSFKGLIYNAIFYNNGLHFEHHDRMQEPVIELTPTPADGWLYKSLPSRKPTGLATAAAARAMSHGQKFS